MKNRTIANYKQEAFHRKESSRGKFVLYEEGNGCSKQFLYANTKKP